MLLLRLPGVYHPQDDTWLLAEALDRERLRPGARVLDVGTGTGALAVLAAHRGATVTAVDTSRRALGATWLNSRSRGLSVRTRRGDLLAPVLGERFDVVLTNPPYVPASDDRLPSRGRRRAWDAGVNGRALLDRLCTQAPTLLAPSGVLLVVHSAMCGAAATVEQLELAGLAADVVARAEIPFGPVLRARAALLERRGLIAPGQRHEELVVVRATRSEQGPVATTTGSSTSRWAAPA